MRTRWLLLLLSVSLGINRLHVASARSAPDKVRHSAASSIRDPEEKDSRHYSLWDEAPQRSQAAVVPSEHDSHGSTTAAWRHALPSDASPATGSGALRPKTQSQYLQALDPHVVPMTALRPRDDGAASMARKQRRRQSAALRASEEGDAVSRSGRDLLGTNSWYWFCATFDGPVCATCQLIPYGFDPCIVGDGGN